MWSIAPCGRADHQLMKNEQLIIELHDTVQLHDKVCEVQTQNAAGGAQTVQAVPVTEHPTTTVTHSGRSPLSESNVDTEQAVRATRAMLHVALSNSSMHCIQGQTMLTLKQKKLSTRKDENPVTLMRRDPSTIVRVRSTERSHLKKKIDNDDDNE